MEYCALGSIRDMIETLSSPLTEPEIAFVTLFTIRGLAVLHAKGIIHRDVKAANILLTEEGSVKIGKKVIQLSVLNFFSRFWSF
jgi:serine/threonine protein kinase